jgi:hypothetical protein
MAAIRSFFNVATVTAPDYFIGWPGLGGVDPSAPVDPLAFIDEPAAPKRPIKDGKFSSKEDLAAEVAADADLLPAMTVLATREFKTEWDKATSDDEKIDLFYRKVFEEDRVLPVYHDSNDTITMVRLDRDRPIERFLLSLWGKDHNSKVAGLVKKWTGGDLPLFPGLTKSLVALGSGGGDQEVLVCPEPGYREHIIEIS